MYFYMPTYLYNEKNAVKNHANLLASYGKKALIVTGKHSAKINGSLNDVTAALESCRISYVIYDKIEENPSVETIDAAARFGICEQADFVIGIGGGSPMDAAKAIAILMKHPMDDPYDLYTTENLDALPVIAIPTTCGTGSEVTPYSILTNHKLKTKRGIPHPVFPELSLADWHYLEAAGPELIIHTATDALGHLIESYLNTTATDYSKMLCEYGFSLWGSQIPALTARTFSAENYQTLMTASTLAGMAITHTSTSLPHGLSYYLTYEKNVPHGKAVGIYLAAYVNASPDKKAVQKLLSLLGFSSVTELHTLLTDLLGKLSLTHAETDACIDAMLSNPKKLELCPYPVDKNVLLSIFTESVNIQ